MKVRVLFFASIADAAGARSLEVEVEGRETVADLRKRLESDRARLAGKLGKCAAAVNTQVVDGSRVLAEGDEVAFLPPVSGGVA